jgi:hypothetical protein
MIHYGQFFRPFVTHCHQPALELSLANLAAVIFVKDAKELGKIGRVVLHVLHFLQLL